MVGEERIPRGARDRSVGRLYGKVWKEGNGMAVKTGGEVRSDHGKLARFGHQTNHQSSEANGLAEKNSFEYAHRCVFGDLTNDAVLIRQTAPIE